VQELRPHAQAQQPALHVFDPRSVRGLPLVVAGPDEVLDFHLLELSAPENEVPRRDFVPKRFPDLRDAERHFSTAHFTHVFEVDENALPKKKET
jgi:hypothetical protein